MCINSMLWYNVLCIDYKQWKWEKVSTPTVNLDQWVIPENIHTTPTEEIGS
jgi:hypothetical protein